MLGACPSPNTPAAGRAPSVEQIQPGADRPVPDVKPSVPATPRPTPTPPALTPARGVPAVERWLFWRGKLADVGVPSQLAERYGLIVVDADPAMGLVTAQQVEQLKAGGKTRVLGWLGLGAVSAARPFWKSYVEKLEVAHIGPKADEPDATWIDPSNSNYANGLIQQQAKPIAGTGVDGFLLDDVVLAEHLPDAADGPCDPRCRQGMLDLIARLRTAFPDKLLIVRGATSDLLRYGTSTSRQSVAAMLDGVVGTSVYVAASAPPDPGAGERQLAAWRDMKLELNGRPFFLGVHDDAPGCSGAADAAARARAAGFAPAIVDAASRKPCATE